VKARRPESGSYTFQHVLINYSTYCTFPQNRVLFHRFTGSRRCMLASPAPAQTNAADALPHSELMAEVAANVGRDCMQKLAMATLCFGDMVAWGGPIALTPHRPG
jgi:hypothetical protein